MLKLLSDRRQQLVDQRIMAFNRLHRLLTELVPGGVERRLTPHKARQLLASVRPRDQVGKARKPLALDHAKDVERLDMSSPKSRPRHRSRRQEEPDESQRGPGRGAGDDRADPRRGRRRSSVPEQGPLRSYTGSAPIDVSYGDHVRHRLNRGGNRRFNHALHVAALV